jgi:hypothetical protein
MAPLHAQAERLRAGAAELRGLELPIEAGAPWPMSDFYAPGPESSWGPPEILAHVSEMLPYWLGEIERILDGHRRAATMTSPPEPVPFGRTESDPVRIALIGRDRTIPIRELIARIEADAERIATRLESLTDSEAAQAGLHPTRGVLTVTELLEPFIVGHLEGHIRQLRQQLDDGGETGSKPGAA